MGLKIIRKLLSAAAVVVFGVDVQADDHRKADFGPQTKTSRTGLPDVDLRINHVPDVLEGREPPTIDSHARRSLEVDREIEGLDEVGVSRAIPQNDKERRQERASNRASRTTDESTDDGLRMNQIPEQFKATTDKHRQLRSIPENDKARSLQNDPPTRDIDRH